MNENWYLILELEFDPPVEDQVVIDQKIEEKRKFWATNFNDFKRGIEYKHYYNMLKYIKTIMSDPVKRKEQADAARKEVYDQLDKDLTILGLGREITEDIVKNVANRTKVSLDVVKKRVAALGIKIGKNKVDFSAVYDKYYKNKPEGAANYEDKKTFLQTFNKDNFYDFLNPGNIKDMHNLPCNILRERASEMKTEFKTCNVRSSSGKKLCEVCEMAFKNENSKRIYDEYLEWCKRRSILDYAKEIAKMAENELTNEQGDVYIGQLTKLLKDRTLAENVFISFCKVEKIWISNPNLQNSTFLSDKIDSQHTEHDIQIVTQMHTELQKYKGDMYAQIIRPVLFDIIEVRESILRTNSTYLKKSDGEQDIPSELFTEHAFEIQDILEKNGVEIYKSSPEDDFVLTKQRAIKKEVTGNKELNGKVAESLSYGYNYNGRTIYAEKIAIYNYEEPVEVITENNREKVQTGKYVYGIDLGTTYSCIAYADETGAATVIKNIEGINKTPSVVNFASPNQVFVGQVAKETAVIEPNTISFVTTLMGKTNFAINYNGEDRSPEEVSAYILRKLTEDAAKVIGKEVKDVVITCPAYFGTAERIATKNAGKIAGLNVLEIISEPVAAAIYYGYTREKEEKTVLVYDLGGATLDITILSIDSKKIEVISSDGGHDLGGKDWDTAIMRYLVAEFASQTGYDGDFDAEEMQDLVYKAEKAKQQLSAKETIIVIVGAAGKRARISLSRETFDEITSALLNYTIDKTDDAIAMAESKGYKVDEIILVGGSTRMPQVRKILAEKYGKQPKFFEPDEAVAKGAAIHAVNVYIKNQKNMFGWIDDDNGNINDG